jgi:DNA-directed RNA polymerase subunit M/transcription elongation factor TFIIS
MLHKGARVHGGDYFDDMASKGGGGIYGGMGVEDYDGIRESISPDGLVVTMNCRNCGKQHEVTLEWYELFIVGANNPGLSLMKPKGWEYSQNNGSLYPAHIKCSKCNEGERSLLCPQVTPDEARGHVNSAVSQGLLPVANTQAWGQQVAAYRAANG